MAEEVDCHHISFYAIVLPMASEVKRESLYDCLDTCEGQATLQTLCSLRVAVPSPRGKTFFLGGRGTATRRLDPVPPDQID